MVRNIINADMIYDRKSQRFNSPVTQAIVQGLSKNKAILVNISVTGCCVEYDSFPEVKLNSKYKIAIIPKKETSIGKFVLAAESKWTTTGDVSCKIGFSIVESPKKKEFFNYVDYLSWISKNLNQEKE